MKTISFYSYKGGVGRSLALAYTAKYLAQINFRVCILDIDLEAPGLIYKFEVEPDPQKKGVVDYIYSCIKENQVPTNIEDYFYTYQESNYGYIKLMNAGKGINAKEYWDKLSQIDWEDLFLGEYNEGLYLFENLKRQIKRQMRPDFLFIDSRSGVTVMSKVCNSVLPDAVVMLLTNNNENYNGSKIMYNHITYSENYKVNKERTDIVCAITRIPQPEDGADICKESDIINKFIKKVDNPFLKEANIVIIHSDRYVEYEEFSVFQNIHDDARPIIGDYYQLITKIIDKEMLASRKTLIINKPKYRFLKFDLWQMVEIELKNLQGSLSYSEFYSNLKKNKTENPNEAHIQYKLSLCERYSGNIIEAVAGLSKVISNIKEEDAWTIHAHYLRGLIFLYDLNNYNDAINDLKTVYIFDPSFNLRINYDLAACFLCIEQYNDAIEYACRYLSENKLDYHAFHLRAIANHEKIRFDIIRGKTTLFEKNRIIMDYNKAIEINPNFEYAYNNRGGLYASLGENEKALSDYNKAIEINPRFESAYYNRGSLYSDSGKNEKALSDYNKAIEINPNYESAYTGRGNLYYNLGEKEKALSDYNKAIEINSNFEYAYNGRGTLYSDSGEKEKALSDYNKAIEINPNFEQAYYGRGNLYSDLDEKEKALSNYNRAIEINPNFVYAYNGRGNLYYNLGEKEKALSDYNKAIEINPNFVYAYNGRGNLYYNLGKKEKALSDYNKAIGINPNYEYAYNGRGCLYSDLGENEKALRDYNMAIEINPNYKSACKNRDILYSKMRKVKKS